MVSGGGWSDVGVDGTHRYGAAALSVFWPEGEFHILIARWPHLAAQVGATWDEHRRRVERHCVLVQQAGLQIQQLPGDVKGFEAFLAARRVATPGADDVAGYPDMRTATMALSS